MIRWGTIGAGNIVQRFIEGLSYSKNGKLYAVASRTEAKREEFQKRFPDIRVYADYNQLLHDENVDVVYIATWHNSHYQWAKQALLCGKAVLCEKPATLYAWQMEELATIAKEKHVFFMEAMKTRFVPAVLELKQQLADGVIGDIVKLENRFCYDISQASNTRYLFEKEQGGILNDVGSYNIASLLDYIHAPIQNVDVKTVFEREVDCHDYVTVSFTNGQKGYLEMAMNEAKTPLMVIEGTLGQIECAPFYRPSELTIKKHGQQPYKITKAYIHDDFYTEIEEVHHCLAKHLYESPRMTLDDSINCVKLVERIRKAMEEKYEI